jgi:hypothetical protein
MEAKTETVKSHKSIFDEYWWFDAACPGSWDVCEVHRDNRLVGSLAFTRFRKVGFRHIQMPNLTRTLQPHIDAPGTKAVSRLQNQASILTDLLDRLPEFDRFELCLPPESELALPFTLAGLSNAATFTYRCEASHDSDPWQAMEQKTRNAVASAKKRFQVEFHHDLDRYFRLSRASFAHLGQTDRTDYEAVRRIFEASILREQATVITATNAAQEDVAAAILVWDAQTLYLWQTVREREGSGNSAISLLIWEACLLSHEMGCQFDLDGFITRQSGLFLAKFGFKPAVRTYVRNVNPLWTGFYGLKQMLKPADKELSYR